MKRVPDLFDEDKSVMQGSEWVVNKEGHVERLHGGECYMMDAHGDVYVHVEVEIGGEKPEGFKSTGVANDKVRGWEPNKNKEVGEVLRELRLRGAELVNRSMQVSPIASMEGEYSVMPHGHVILADIKDRSFKGIKRALSRTTFKGYVFVHEDGVRKAKVTRKMMGLEITDEQK